MYKATAPSPCVIPVDGPADKKKGKQFEYRMNDGVFLSFFLSIQTE